MRSRPSRRYRAYGTSLPGDAMVFLLTTESVCARLSRPFSQRVTPSTRSLRNSWDFQDRPASKHMTPGISRRLSSPRTPERQGLQWTAQTVRLPVEGSESSAYNTPSRVVSQ